MAVRALTAARAAALCLALLAGAAHAAPGDGERLYLHGIGVDGAPVGATVAGGVPVAAAATACVNCHKRSGYGTSEARVRSAPLAGRVLFAPVVAGARPRPAYDADALFRALTTGVAPGARTLDLAMPRYALTRADAAALADYLRGLGASAPGVDARTLDVVTIVSDSAPAEVTAALLAVVERFVADKNAGSRNEARRAAASLRHSQGERRDRAWREWRWRVWRLHGAPSEWPAQLDALHAERAPFAVLSASVGRDWSVVHGWCESRQLPCVLPITDLPPDRPHDFYSLYFHGGAPAEARAIARHLVPAEPIPVRVLVLRQADPTAAAAAETVRATASREGADRVVLDEQVLAASASSAELERAFRRARPDVVVALLPPPALRAVGAAALRDGVARVYTAESFAPWGAWSAPPALDVLHAYPYRIARTGAQFPRESVWLQGHGLGNLPAVPASLALFACHAFGEGLSDLNGVYSREYFLESLEHLLDDTQMTSVLPRTTLAAGQRTLSKGAWLLRAGAGGRYSTADWVTAN